MEKERRKMIGINGKELPCKECGGKCCYYPPIETKVYKKLEALGKIPKDAIIEKKWEGTSKEAYVVTKNTTDPMKAGECSFLKDGRCEIYTYRPYSCRAVGVKIPCAYVDPVATRKMIDNLRLIPERKYE